MKVLKRHPYTVIEISPILDDVGVVDIAVVIVIWHIDIIGRVIICLAQTFIEHLGIQVGPEQIGFAGSHGLYLHTNPNRYSIVHTYKLK